jgi:hypothetical protein
VRAFQCLDDRQRQFGEPARSRKRQHEQFMVRHRRAENFFIIRPALLSDCSPTRAQNTFRFRNFQPRTKFSISMRLRTRLQFPRYDTENCSPQQRGLQRLRCFNFNEVHVVTLAQRRENDSL